MTVYDESGYEDLVPEDFNPAIKGRADFYYANVEDVGYGVTSNHDSVEPVVKLRPEDFKDFIKLVEPAPFQIPEATKAPTAHRFRTDRLRQGAVGEFVRGLQEDGVTKHMIGVMTGRREGLNASEPRYYEHRALTAFLTGIMSRPDKRREFVDAMDETAREESDQLKEQARENGGLRVDVLIVGAGIQGSVAAARIRATHPELSVMVVDKGHRLGGQFGSYGMRPTFRTNGRAHRPQHEDGVALPNGEDNLNPFSKYSVLQLPNISSETYPDNVVTRDAAATSLFFSAPTMLGVALQRRQRPIIVDDNSLERITVRDTATSEDFTIDAQRVLLLTGSGERAEASRKAEGIWTAEELLSHFGDESNIFPMDAFVGKSIAVIGGGDTGRIVNELLTRLAPKEAYGNSVAQLGGPNSITWYGVNFDTRDEYCEQNRSRYNQLSSFIANVGEFLSGARFIRPTKSRVSAIEPSSGGYVGVTDENNSTTNYDIVIDCRSLTKQRVSAVEGLRFLLTENVTRTLRGLGECAVGLRQLASQVYKGGPAAGLPLTAFEQASYKSERNSQNPVAIWANSRRVEALADTVTYGLEPVS